MFMKPKVLNMLGSSKIVSTGVLPSLPDLRDYSDNHERILPYARAMGIAHVPKEDLPISVNLREGFSGVEDQGSLGSCTAHAAVGLLEYMERRAHGGHIDASRMFLYNATKYLLGWKGDTGAYLRTAAAALRLFGCPPEAYLGYDKILLDVEPSSYLASLAANYKGIDYFRYDAGTNTPPECVLATMKKYIAAGIPAMFGFYGFDSFSYGSSPGDVPLPGPSESARWAHAVIAAGYHDDFTITNTRAGLTTRGAFLFRNSWGSDWGRNGYGWIPYDYVLRRYIWDVWSFLSFNWVDTKQFGLNL